jgi:hypothetical protein
MNTVDRKPKPDNEQDNRISPAQRQVQAGAPKSKFLSVALQERGQTGMALS